MILPMKEEEMKKYLAIDYGRKRIGLAVGAYYPSGLGVIDNAQNREAVISKIIKFAGENGVSGIVVGLPIRSHGEPGTLNTEIKEFAKKVADKSGLEVFFEDEQFSSTEAERQFSLHGKKVSRKSGEIDEMAAILILEQFLNKLQESKATE